MADRAALIRWSAALMVALTVVGLSLAGLLLADDATVGRARLGPYYPALLAGAGVLAVALGAVIALQVLRLVRALRRSVPGARLNARLVLVFVALSLPPALLVFTFGLNFLFGAVDSRFAAPVSDALDDALDVGRLYLEERRADAETQVDELAGELLLLDADGWPAALSEALDRGGNLQLAAFAADGSVIANVSADPDWLAPEPPPEALRLRAIAQGATAVVESRGETLVLRAVATVQGGGLLPGGQLLQAISPVPERYAQLTRRIEAAVADYRQLEFLRDSLKLSMAIILGLVLLLVLLAALLLALRASRRIAAPVARLADATRAIARGEFGRPLAPSDTTDELGDLIGAFNRMTRELGSAQGSVREKQAQLEAQRTYLDAVLARISSAVIALDADGRIGLFNAAAERLLGLEADEAIGTDPESLASERPELAGFAHRVAERLRDSGSWNEEVRIERAAGPQVLLVRGSPLSVPGAGRGLLLVFDDARTLNRAQREAAWAEVARRLAHEIKNPLTPIQLSAERLRRRYLGRLPPDDAEVLERATGTIVTQVESLKSLVNAFADYARPAPPKRSRIGLNALVDDVLGLYTQDPRLAIEREVSEGELLVRADPDRLRQVLHNLIKNAIEAMADGAMRLHVGTGQVSTGGVRMACVSIRDHGPGLPEGFDLAAMEPYRSDKPRGSGLGLVIVQRIVEEHGGRLEAVNAPGGGALFRVLLPS